MKTHLRADFARNQNSEEFESTLSPDEWEGDEGRIWHTSVRPRPIAEQPASRLSPVKQQDEPAPGSQLKHKPGERRYDRALIDCRNAEAEFVTAFRITGPTSELTVSAASAAAEARVTFARVKTGYAQHGDMMRWIDEIEAHRQTPEGRAAHNAKRRKKRDRPNTDLSGMSLEERAEHKKRMEREKKQRQRAAKRAASREQGAST